MRSGKLTVRRAAARDLSEEARWLRERVGAETAERYLEAAWGSFATLAEQPGLGPPADAKAPGLRDARKWRVRGFSDELIFYAPKARGGVTILRVLHAAQDWRVP